MNSDAYQQQQMAAGYNQSNPYESNENHYITNTSAPNDPPPVCNAPPPYNNPPAQNNYPPATNPNPYNNPNSYPRNPHQNINVFQPNPYNRVYFFLTKPPPPLPPQSAQPIIILTNNSQRGPPLCPICRQHAGTLAVRKTGTTQWIWCFLLFLCFWPASCIPFCVDSCSDI